MKVYLAARYLEKERIAAYATELVKLGFTVTSTWTQEDYQPTVSMQAVPILERGELAKRDLAEIFAAQVLVLFTIDPDAPMVRGGMHFESGYAYGIGKKILVVGPCQNIFHYLPGVVKVDTWEEGIEWLKKERKMTTRNSATI